MTTRKVTTLVASAAILLAGLAGCPDNPNGGGQTDPNSTTNGNGSFKAIAGTWRGNLDCTLTMTLSSLPGNPTTSTSSQVKDITFNSDGTPADLDYMAFSAAAASHCTILQVGQSTTVTYQVPGSSGDSLTQTITVREAIYLSEIAHLVYDYSFHGTLGGLPCSGTGSQSWDCVVTGNTMSYATTCTYDITETVNLPDPNNVWHIIPQVVTARNVTDCHSATLQRQ
jgi:hypothetical protein